MALVPLRRTQNGLALTPLEQASDESSSGGLGVVVAFGTLPSTVREVVRWFAVSCHAATVSHIQQQGQKDSGAVGGKIEHFTMLVGGRHAIVSNYLVIEMGLRRGAAKDNDKDPDAGCGGGSGWRRCRRRSGGSGCRSRSSSDSGSSVVGVAGSEG